MSRAVGHEVFEVPESDALHAREAAAAMGGMPGMDMPGMSMPGMGAAEPPEHGAGGADAGKEPAHGEQPMAPMKMDLKMEEGAGHQEGDQMASGMPSMDAGKEPAQVEQPMAPMKMEMKMEEGAGHQEAGQMASGMPSMDAGKEPGHGAQAPAPGMAMPGMERMEGAETGGHGGGGGLALVAPGMPMAASARTVQIEMSEWGFSPASLDVKHGELVRLVVRNTGNMPHEFMLMSPAGMSAVDYRLQRADWNLLEHEAIYERELMLPGDELEVIIRIMQPGAWMYMCMFPYHMQFGMMGVMATEGMAMDMGGMSM
jgi:uncharacterized cupredoxin-like copper-binding protein